MFEKQNLLNKIDRIAIKSNQLLDATGVRFNIFQILGVTTAETRLHSAFITELLNPHGSHGLNDKFLQAFIKKCLADEFEFKTANAKSKCEHYIGVKTETTGGQIDIIIWDTENRAIIIENKIYAGDQENQMLRYYDHSQIYSDSRLIYLSLEGKVPSAFSTGVKSFKYLTLSYKFDILPWLVECKQIAVDFPLVREAISHYINLIKQLTNTSYMNETNNEIVELITQSSTNLQNAIEINKALTDVKIKIQWEFWKQLQKSLENRGLKMKEGDHSNHVKHWKVKGYYEKQRNKDIWFGLWVEIYNQDGITLHWGCELEYSIYVGFTVEKNGRGGISKSEEMKPFRQLINNCDVRYKTSDNWLGWQYTSPLLNFREFNSIDVFRLADKMYLEEITNQIADKAVCDITFVLNELKVAEKPATTI